MKLLAIIIALLLSTSTFALDVCRVTIDFQYHGSTRQQVRFNQALKLKTVKKLRKAGLTKDIYNYQDIYNLVDLKLKKVKELGLPCDSKRVVSGLVGWGSYLKCNKFLFKHLSN
jgi:hypothetical protein